LQNACTKAAHTCDNCVVGGAVSNARLMGCNTPSSASSACPQYSESIAMFTRHEMAGTTSAVAVGEFGSKISTTSRIFGTTPAVAS